MIFLYYWFVFNFKDFFTCANYTNRQEMYFFISNILKTLRPNSSTCDITQSREKKKISLLVFWGCWVQEPSRHPSR